MRLLIEYRRREDEERRARGEPVAALGVSPGFRDLQWLKPVYAGDTVSYASEVIETRPLASRPGWGLVSSRNTGVNQRGEPVISFISSVFVERRRRRRCAMSVATDKLVDRAAADLAAKRDERRAAGVACGAHALHDGYTDLIYVMLPIWQKEFGLGYAELGLLRGLFAGTMAGFQIPAALLAERLGRRGGAGARHRARRRSAIAWPAPARASPADGGAVRRRARRQHPASARLER